MTRAPSGGGNYCSTGSTSLADFKQLSLLGEGAYSAVYKVLRLTDNEVYALKKVKLPSLSDKEKQNALNEVRLLASVQHDHVIAYKEAFWDDKSRCLCIVQEIADAGDLLQQINRCKQERAYLREADIWRYLDGMCQGLRALHDLRILHRDMKCANVFLSNSRDGPIAKLGDFNVSKVAKRGLCMTQTGTPYYASPEVWRDMPYDAKSDMWSLGCVLYEMVALRPPFRAEDMEGLYRKVVRGQYPRIPAHYSQDLADVIAALLQVHPRNRPSVDQLLQMPALMRHTPNLVRDDSKHPSDLLSTIKLPKNAIDLSSCLPKPRYTLPDVLHEVQEVFQDSPGSARNRSSNEGSRPRHQASDQMPPIAQRRGLPAPGGQQNSYDERTEVGGLDSLDAYLQQRHEAPEPEQRAAQAYIRNNSRSVAAAAREDYQGRPPPQDEGVSRQPKLPSVEPNGNRGLPAPSINPHCHAGSNAGSRPREPRRPMAIYARQQYAAPEPAQAEPAQAPKPRRSLIPRLF